MKSFVRIDHVTLMVKDLATSVKFYTEKLGFSVYGETPTEDGRKTVFLRSGNALFDLYGMTGKAPPFRKRLENEVGLVHIALKVEDFQETYKELVEKGVRFHIKPFYQPKSGRRIAFFKDPDDNVLHITDGKQ